MARALLRGRWNGVAACSTAAEMPRASNEQPANALAFRAPSGMARVYVLNGQKRSLVWGDVGHTPGDYSIDGTRVCSLNAGEYFLIDLPSGVHALTWHWRTRKLVRTTDVPTQLALRPGDVVCLRSVEDLRQAELSSIPYGVGAGLGGAAADAIAAGGSSSSVALAFEDCRAQSPPLLPKPTLVVTDTDAATSLADAGARPSDRPPDEARRVPLGAEQGEARIGRIEIRRMAQTAITSRLAGSPLIRIRLFAIRYSLASCPADADCDMRRISIRPCARLHQPFKVRSSFNTAAPEVRIVPRRIDATGDSR